MEKVTITLSPENGSFQGKKVVILSQPVSLGRLMENQEPQTATFLRFNSKVVSRNHAKLWFENNKVLFDLGTNLIIASFTCKILKALAGHFLMEKD
jgi:hypothetical protein